MVRSSRSGSNWLSDDLKSYNISFAAANDSSWFFGTSLDNVVPQIDQDVINYAILTLVLGRENHLAKYRTLSRAGEGEVAFRACTG